MPEVDTLFVIPKGPVTLMMFKWSSEWRMCSSLICERCDMEMRQHVFVDVTPTTSGGVDEFMTMSCVGK